MFLFLIFTNLKNIFYICQKKIMKVSIAKITNKKVGRKPINPAEKKIQVIFYVRANKANEFKNKVINNLNNYLT